MNPIFIYYLFYILIYFIYNNNRYKLLYKLFIIIYIYYHYYSTLNYINKYILPGGGLSGYLEAGLAGSSG